MSNPDLSTTLAFFQAAKGFLKQVPIRAISERDRDLQELKQTFLDIENILHPYALNQDVFKDELPLFHPGSSVKAYDLNKVSESLYKMILELKKEVES